MDVPEADSGELIRDAFQPMPLRKKEILNDGDTKVSVLSTPTIRGREVRGVLKLGPELVIHEDVNGFCENVPTFGVRLRRPQCLFRCKERQKKCPSPQRRRRGGLWKLGG